MRVLRLNRTDENFYNLLGPVFGSRIVERMTRDRFYDDPGKQWYLVPNQGAASVLDHVIRNFWAVSEPVAVELIQAILEDFGTLSGILPNVHENSFRKMGFQVAPYRKNFIEVHYEEN